ncbi:Hsp33 family molecular chaperone HslO [Phosphitispora fastidiosa]|uniref:Hsp33 family molecular chaperone HslO n=1 Tax=Phosphitispora fastidiosa TaxID=2837202 RepID=UPI001E4421FD|nr:Hsp33 family molecular chaperone HslO [Phosphitispora fastidiosa]MBU7005517.1 molecular chaperone Hsp33 [Phosphitispora fastidiosa]
MKDYLVVGTNKKENLRVYAAVTTGLAEEARRRHDTSPTASAALGRGLTAGVLMSANLKGDDLLTLRIIGDGPLGALIVTSDSAGNVRGYAQCPEADLPSRNGKLDVGGLVGKKGELYVTKNMGLKDSYTGSVPIVSGEIGEDIAYYYARSEQIPSVVALGVLVDTDISVRAAGGYLVQAFPGAGAEDLAALEQRALSLPGISSLINEGSAPEEWFKILLGDFVEIDRRPVSFLCRCSREKIEQVLIGMGEAEIRDIIEHQRRTEIRCHFCGEKYYFERHEMEKLLKEAQS